MEEITVRIGKSYFGFGGVHRPPRTSHFFADTHSLLSMLSCFLLLTRFQSSCSIVYPTDIILALFISCVITHSKWWYISYVICCNVPLSLSYITCRVSTIKPKLRPCHNLN